MTQNMAITINFIVSNIAAFVYAIWIVDYLKWHITELEYEIRSLKCILTVYMGTKEKNDD
jgi:hypothetical protein